MTRKSEVPPSRSSDTAPNDVQAGGEVPLDAVDRALHRLYHGDTARCVTPEQAAERQWPVVQCLWASPVIGEPGDKTRRLLELLADEGLSVAPSRTSPTPTNRRP